MVDDRGDLEVEAVRISASKPDQRSKVWQLTHDASWRAIRSCQFLAPGMACASKSATPWSPNRPERSGVARSWKQKRSVPNSQGRKPFEAHSSGALSM